jgi:hypothetical protein
MRGIGQDSVRGYKEVHLSASCSPISVASGTLSRERLPPRIAQRSRWRRKTLDESTIRGEQMGKERGSPRMAVEEDIQLLSSS